MKINIPLLILFTLIAHGSLSLPKSGGALWISQAEAAPESRGAMGTVVTLGAGGFFGAGTDNVGARSPSQVGGLVHFMIGEEVLPRLSVGVSLDSYFGSSQGDDRTTSQLFGFGFESRYRITQGARGLYLLGGLGIGVGGVIAEGESLVEAEGSGGGSVWKLGVGYELGDSKFSSGFIYAPSVTFQRLGPQMESEVSVNLISLSLDVIYATGR